MIKKKTPSHNDYFGSLILPNGSQEEGLGIFFGKRAEDQIKHLTELLGFLNDSNDFIKAIENIITKIKLTTGLDAVGIRFQQGDDFPFFAQQGFSNDFLLTENTLAACSPDGQVCRDENGKISLECTCGLVISGRTDPKNSFFTDGGSAWTNDTFQFSEVTEGIDIRHNPRKSCILKGYGSVAIIPIRANNKIVGTLQLNGRKKNCFSLEMILFYERFCASIGTGLALRERKTRYHSFFESSLDAIMTFESHSWQLISANTSTIQMFMATDEAYFTSLDFWKLSPESQPDGRLSIEKAKEMLEKAMHEGSCLFEWTYKRLNGEVFPSTVLLNQMEIWGKKFIQATVRDITGSKRAERENEEKIRLLLNSTAEAIYGLDTDGNCTFCNKTCLSMLGYHYPEELLGKNMHWLIHQKHADGTHFPVEDCRIFQAFQKGEGTHVVDEVLWRSDGKSFPAEYWSYPQINDGIVTGAVVTFLDISERKRAEDLLQQTRQNYETFFNTINDFLFVLDEQGNIIHTNNTVSDRLGFTHEELFGKSILTVHPPERRDEAGRIVGEMLSGITEFCPVPIITKTGVQIPVETRVSRGFWDGKHAIFGVTKDISKIKLSEEKFSKIFYLNPSACSLTDLYDNKYVEVNEAFYLLLGFDKNEVIGKTAIDLGILSSEAIMAILQKADINGNVSNAEADLKAKNGDIKHVLMSAENIYIQDKKYRFTVVQDITEIKRIQEKLALSEAEMRTTLYSIGDAVISLDSDTRILIMNPVAEKLTGWSESEAHGKLLEDVFCIVNEETRCKVDNPVVRVLSEGNVVEMPIQTLLIARDGTERPIGDSAAPIFDRSSKVNGVVLIFRDLTKEREAEKKIVEQLANIETYNGFIALVDMNGKLIYVNAGGIKMLGATKPEEILDKNITDFFEESKVKNITDEWIPVSIRDKVWNGEHTIKRIDGLRIPVSQTIFSIRDVDGNVRYLGTIITDISIQKEMQEKLLISEQLAVMGRLVADVAHELNNPLAIIIGRTQLILHRIDEQSKQFKGQLETILHSARRCKNILSNLLTYSRTIGKKENAVNLPDLIREAVDNVNYQYEMSSIEVVMNFILPTNIEITGNKTALLSVFVNLIRNARQAMPHKGNLVITVEKESESLICIEIRDTGIGITKEQLTKLFQPFISGWIQEEGTGLGLATSLGIIETYGGKMWAESEGEGKGAKFTILLPYKLKND